MQDRASGKPYVPEVSQREELEGTVWVEALCPTCGFSKTGTKKYPAGYRVGFSYIAYQGCSENRQRLK
ncbi:hypothetical protein HY950_02580 [Candidatus Gottesmanbacteria bacterium]|nr:hypothetical protein [Candidatus Gottesmanbacteria bacterium]